MKLTAREPKTYTSLSSAAIAESVLPGSSLAPCTVLTPARHTFVAWDGVPLHDGVPSNPGIRRLTYHT